MRSLRGLLRHRCRRSQATRAAIRASFRSSLPVSKTSSERLIPSPIWRKSRKKAIGDRAFARALAALRPTCGRCRSRERCSRVDRSADERRTLDAGSHRARRRGARALKSGANSQDLKWKAIAEADPDVIVVAPCGYDLELAKEAISEIRDEPEWAGCAPFAAVAPARSTETRTSTVRGRDSSARRRFSRTPSTRTRSPDLFPLTVRSLNSKRLAAVGGGTSADENTSSTPRTSGPIRRNPTGSALFPRVAPSSAAARRSGDSRGGRTCRDPARHAHSNASSWRTRSTSLR